MPHSVHSSPERAAPPRILLIDAYDSFSNNIIALVQEQLTAQVTTIKIDDARYAGQRDKFIELLSNFDAVIAGPGPGSATTHEDVGLIKELWDLEARHTVPVLGICLGFQSLAYAFGAKIEPLHDSRHGTVPRIFHNGKSIFHGLGEVYATQYNSLHAIIGHDAQEENMVKREKDLWLPSTSCPELQPLAWVLDDLGNTPTLMAVQHVEKPFWGLQFHPESICTNEAGAQVVQHWWAEVEKYRALKSVRRTSVANSVEVPEAEADEPALPQLNGSEPNDVAAKKVQWTERPLEKLCPVNICTVLDLTADELLLLESSTTSRGDPVNPETGRYSIIGIVSPGKTLHLQYNVWTKQLFQSYGDSSTATAIECDDVWTYIKDFMQERKRVDGPVTSPFWGGLVGFVSYEACLERINVNPLPFTDRHTDMCFAFIERSIVFDHVGKRVFVQSIVDNDDEWTKSTAEKIGEVAAAKTETDTSGSGTISRSSTDVSDDSRMEKGQLMLKMPSSQRYCDKVRQCKDYIGIGESYELCLTEQLKLLVPRQEPATRQPNWEMYARIRKQNPAPFGAYFSLRCREEYLTVLSSSPERFLRWDRHGSCQLRPIKGTVKKEPGLTRKRAEAILHSSKERAENLMIVDLIRHDLHGVVGHRNVRVPKLMTVEEYATVFQLVSVIEGDLALEGDKCGIDVLSSSLPPGSMTGAPKKRSCELLQKIEEYKPRGVYSGVLGYMDVGGGGDFSVVIRTAFKWDSDARNGGQNANDVAGDVWSVGAGGAVTGQSTEIGEWQEMEDKRSVIVGVFKDFVASAPPEQSTT